MSQNIHLLFDLIGPSDVQSVQLEFSQVCDTFDTKNSAARLLQLEKSVPLKLSKDAGQGFYLHTYIYC